jgi:hypothetical protein
MDETPILISSVELNKISEKELLCVISKAKDWALMHGASMRSKTNFDADSLFVSIYQFSCDTVMSSLYNINN